MGFTKIHTDLMYSALDHFIESDTPVHIFRNDLGISFETRLGNLGLVLPNESGDWEIFINNQKIYEIESEVYSIITHEENSPPVEEYLKKLKSVSKLKIKSKSKDFVDSTIFTLEMLVLHGGIKLNTDFTHGPFFIYEDRILNERKIIILN